jgi:hypothetical protein
MGAGIHSYHIEGVVAPEHYSDRLSSVVDHLRTKYDTPDEVKEEIFKYMDKKPFRLQDAIGLDYSPKDAYSSKKLKREDVAEFLLKKAKKEGWTFGDVWAKSDLADIVMDENVKEGEPAVIIDYVADHIDFSWENNSVETLEHAEALLMMGELFGTDYHGEFNDSSSDAKFQTNISYGDSPKGSWFAAHPHISALLALIIGGGAIGGGMLSGVFGPSGGGGGDDDKHEALVGEIYRIGFRGDDSSIITDDLVEMDIVTGPIGIDDSHNFVFFYGVDGFNSTKIHEDFLGGNIGDVHVKGDVNFIPSNEDILVSLDLHKKDNTYKGIELEY